MLSPDDPFLFGDAGVLTLASVVVVRRAVGLAEHLPGAHEDVNMVAESLALEPDSNHGGLLILENPAHRSSSKFLVRIRGQVLTVSQSSYSASLSSLSATR